MAPASRATSAVSSVQLSATTKTSMSSCGIVLHLDGVDEVGDDRLLVARRDDDGIAVVLFGLKAFMTMNQHFENVEELVRVANRENQKHADIEDINEGYLREKLIEHGPLSLSPMLPDCSTRESAAKLAEGDYSGSAHHAARRGRSWRLRAPFRYRIARFAISSAPNNHVSRCFRGQRGALKAVGAPQLRGRA